METDSSTNEKIFKDLDADEIAPEITKIDSLCLNCKNEGVTHLLLTKIPFYKEVVLASFSCNHCGWKNNELQHVAEIQERGVRYVLKVTTPQDLNRQVVKSEWAMVAIPEVDFEIPSKTQEGSVTTIEGVLSRAISGLSFRLQSEPDNEILEKFISQMKDLKEVKKPFTFILDDPSGNSFLQNFLVPAKDPNLEESKYIRTIEQDKLLGIVNASDISSEDASKELDVTGEVLSFATPCPSCGSRQCSTDMKVTKVPHFKDVVIMATTCEACGHRTNEVKSGGGIEPRGTKITLKMTSSRDLTRDLLKSETCSVRIPELELDVGPAALPSRFTTLEGLLVSIRDQLKENNAFLWGDSALPETKKKMEIFLEKLNEIIEGNHFVEVILDDPCGNSYLQNLQDPDPDPNLTVEHYERTFEQNEELGLNDMKTENYES